MANMYPKVLYFIGGPTPTPDQIADADSCGPGVAFRNATLIHPEGPIEAADAIAGPHVPASYAAALPHISDREAVKARMIARNPILAEKLGSAITNAAPTGETDEQRDARIQNAKSRGERKPSVNERNAEPVLPSARTTQSGEARVTHAAPNDGWGTNADPAAPAPASPATAPVTPPAAPEVKPKGRGKAAK